MDVVVAAAVGELLNDLLDGSNNPLEDGVKVLDVKEEVVVGVLPDNLDSQDGNNLLLLLEPAGVNKLNLVDGK